MSKDIVKISNFDAVLEGTLDSYREQVSQAIDAASQYAMHEIVQKTKATAPKGARGTFRKKISWTEIQRSARWDHTYVWYVKAPDYRLTHLLVHGHAKIGGGRTRADPFLQNALNEVLPEYLERVEDALKW